MFARAVIGIVDSQHDRDVFAGCRRGDDDLLGSRFQMTTNLTGVCKDSGRLYDDIHAELFPRQSRWILLIEHHDASTVELEHPSPTSMSPENIPYVES